MNKYELLQKEFKNFAANLTVEDIDFSNKVENLIDGGELNNITWDDNDKMERKVFHYIKEHINEYQDDIIEETVRIKEKYGCTEKYELAAGLYNMDNFYLEAIMDIISKKNGTKNLDFIGKIIDIFDDFLKEKNIWLSIENEEKPIEESGAVIYGSDYFSLEDKINDVFKNEKFSNDIITQLALKTDKGLFVADYETKDEVGYDAMYLAIQPNDTDEYIDIARVKADDNGLELMSFFDLKTENPDRTVEYSDIEIKEIVGGE